MAVGANEIMTLGGQNLPFARDLREALAVYARRTWPTNTSGNAAKAWGIPKSTAKNVLKGAASDTTVTAILRAGGWQLALPVIGAVIGEAIEQHLESEQRAHVERAARLGALVSYLRPVGAADDPDGPGVDHGQSERRAADRRRIRQG